MIPIDTIVSIKSGDEYGGKYTGKLGIIKKFTDDRVGVEFAGLKNHASKYGLFWFKKENVTPSLFDAPKRNDAIIPAALAKALLNFTFGAPRASLGVKQVIFSGPETIVFWLDGTKTIVSCGEGDHNDPYAGFCAAVTKRVFGSTSQAKKVLARTRKETSKRAQFILANGKAAKPLCSSKCLKRQVLPSLWLPIRWPSTFSYSPPRWVRKFLFPSR